jgi:putative flavoprotein involved in K+ transport
MRWMMRAGIADRTVDQLESPQERFASNPHVTGKNGGHTINLHRFSRAGIHLLGHVRGGEGTRLAIVPDLHENLAVADKFAAEFRQGVDRFVAHMGLSVPEDNTPELRDGYDVPEITELDLQAAGISTIVWATGYSFDFSWVQFPIFDEWGYPVQQRGVTSQPGLYFLGLHWMHTIKSALLVGVGDDAAHVAEHIESRR